MILSRGPISWGGVTTHPIAAAWRSWSRHSCSPGVVSEHNLHKDGGIHDHLSSYPRRRDFRKAVGGRASSRNLHCVPQVATTCAGNQPRIDIYGHLKEIENATKRK